MGKAPSKCPVCGEYSSWEQVDTQETGFNPGKAVLGESLFGPLGLIGGALGNEKVTYYCAECGFSHQYNK